MLRSWLRRDAVCTDDVYLNVPCSMLSEGCLPARLHAPHLSHCCDHGDRTTNLDIWIRDPASNSCRRQSLTANDQQPATGKPRHFASRIS